MGGSVWSEKCEVLCERRTFRLSALSYSAVWLAFVFRLNTKVEAAIQAFMVIENLVIDNPAKGNAGRCA